MARLRHIAARVSARMGGNFRRDALHTLEYERADAELKSLLRTNVLPISKIKIGFYYHRAVLAKALCDAAGLNTALARGEYGRAFNIVYLPTPHVLDVMHQPGALLRVLDLDRLRGGTVDMFEHCNETGPLEVPSALVGPKEV
eukprot:UC1_evm1s1233